MSDSERDEQMKKDLAAALRVAITEFELYDDESLHCPDENGVPCQFFKDGTRRYS